MTGKEYAPISVKPETFVRFRAMKAYRQTYDELLSELMDNWERTNKEIGDKKC